MGGHGLWFLAVPELCMFLVRWPAAFRQVDLSADLVIRC